MTEITSTMTGGDGADLLPSAGATPWYTGKITDEATIGHLQTKGWDKDVTAAALGAIAAHREAEKFIGVPANEVLRLPKADDADGLKAFYQKLGAPADAKGYDFSGVKFTDGSSLDDGFSDFLRGVADKLHLPKTEAVKLAEELVRRFESGEASEMAGSSAKIAEGKLALQKEWGPNFDAHLFVAKAGAAALGVSPETVQALEGVMGYAGVMEMFRKAGAINKEDKFILGANPAGLGGVMTKAQATARLADLKNDKEWVARYFKGGTVEKTEMTALQTIITSGQTAMI